MFSPEEAEKGWVYRAANAVHVKTRSSVVRRFLLFREGDPYDPARLAESERNLRALPFIKFASVTAGPEHDGVVDVRVVTQDAWTTEPGASFGSKGGVTTYGFDFLERDLLGWGKQFSISYDKGTERTVRALDYQDPYLFGAYWNGNVLLAQNSDGREEMVEIGRPFYSFMAPWAVDAAVDDRIQTEKIYADGSTFSEFRQTHREARASAGIASIATETSALRWSAGFDGYTDDFAPLSGKPSPVLPDRRDFRFFDVENSFATNDFVKMNFVNRGLRYEDFDLGWQTDFKLGISPAFLGPPHDAAMAALSAARGVRFGEGFILESLSFQSRFDGGIRNGQLSSTTFGVRPLGDAPHQTLVARLQLDRGWRLDRDVQFFADGLTGLRGYRAFSFEGDKRAIVNVEDRITWTKEILQIAVPGIAVFADAGDAEPPGHPLRFSTLKSDAGVGLRLGIARAPENNVFRFDAAYAFQRDPKGRRGLLFSFSSSQAF